MRALVEAVCARPEGGETRVRWWSTNGWMVERTAGVGLRWDADGTPRCWRTRVDGHAAGTRGSYASRADAEAALRAEVARLWPEGEGR